jgi:GTP-binding protein
LSYFIDEARIHVASGKGGHGCVSFRREKYVPKGGPDGGDGGRGGDLIFRVQRNVKTLASIRRNGKYIAQDGQPGRGWGKNGLDGRDQIIVVPPGTRVKDAETGEVLIDFLDVGQELVFFRGGKGGLGNMHFATSRNQAPRYAQTGLPGASRDIILELSLIADIGFVGFPNAGKSSLLKSLTAANPKIGPYPFTTKIPNLGVMHIHETDIVLADIPGIIAGASHGAGLGLRFLKHIARVAGIAFMIDMGDGDDHGAVYRTLNQELASYGHGLEQLPRIVLASKMDMESSQEALEAFRAEFPDLDILPISSHSRLGIQELQEAFFQLWQAHDRILHPDAPEADAAMTSHPYAWEGSETLDVEYQRRLDETQEE